MHASENVVIGLLLLVVIKYGVLNGNGYDTLLQALTTARITSPTTAKILVRFVFFLYVCAYDVHRTYISKEKNNGW